MSTGLHELLDDDVDAAVERMLTPKLANLLRARDAGHCARVTDAHPALAVKLCRRLRSALGSDAQVHVLAGSAMLPTDVAVNGTKLVELRNPDAEGRQGPPLLIFIPPGTHTSAEDSFGVATFEHVDLGDVYEELSRDLLSGLPSDLRWSVDEVLAALAERPWPHTDLHSRARYLLTVRHNDCDPAAAGAALFELGLVPDFTLFDEPSQVRTRVGRNARCVDVLTAGLRPIRARVVELGLTDDAFRTRLAEFCVESGLEDPREWARRIVVDRANWPLSFHRWPLSERTGDDAVRIDVAELGLPRAGDNPQDAHDPVLGDLIGQLYLPTGSGGLNQMPVSFTVSPPPKQVAGLSAFSVQLLSEDGGPTGVSARVRLGATGRDTYKATLKQLRTAGLETGWHFVRVLPLDADGVPYPLEPTEAADHPPYESDRFFVVADGDYDEIPERRTRKDVGVTHALLHLAFQACADGRDWQAVRCRSVAWRSMRGHRDRVLEAVVDRGGTIQIAVSPTLAHIEQNILAEPERLVLHRLPIESGRTGEPTREALAWPDSTADVTTAFHAARRAALGAVHGTNGMVVEGCVLPELHELARDYAEAYHALVAWQLRRAEQARPERLPHFLAELTGLLQLDTVSIDYTDASEMRREVLLVAPTHPLRLLRLVAWATLGRVWLRQAADTDRATAAAAREALLTRVPPLGFPLAVPLPDGRLTIATEDLNPYWGAYLPSEADDPQGLLGAVADALEIRDRAHTGGTVTGRKLADRVEQYARLHPYACTLVINVLNPGRADHLADMLVDLQHRQGTRHLHFDIRLFAPDPQAPGTGEALAALLRGDGGKSADAEAFHTPPAAGTGPKLTVSVRPAPEFSSAASQRPAHLTMLFDAFGSERIDAAATGDAPPVPAPVYGLVQDAAVTYIEDDDHVAWRMQPRHGVAAPIPGAEDLADILSSLPAMLSSAAAVTATGQPGPDRVPRITRELDVADRALLYQAHHHSDWVVIVDRTLGVEYFDAPASKCRPVYVIDYGPDGTAALGHRIVVSSRSVDELRAMVGPALAQHDIAVSPRHLGSFFDQLRLLSGRLAFKLASAAGTQRTEVLGLALARCFLASHGALRNQVVIPLDAHLELYRDARRGSTDISPAVQLHRTDLALFHLDPNTRAVTCRLVEVKSYTSLGDLAAYQHLKDRMAQQLLRSESILAENFDPSRNRLDRAVKNAELSGLLRYYLDRAVRHEIMDVEAARDARTLLDTLDLGYRLEFTRTGLLFDLSGSGEGRETEAGIEYHRIGREAVRRLLDEIGTDPALAGQTITATGPAWSLPRIAEAAFLAPVRSPAAPQGAAGEADEEYWDHAGAADTAVGAGHEQDPEAEVPGEGLPQDAPGRSTAVVEPRAGTPLPESAPPSGEQPPSGENRSAITPDVVLGTAVGSPQYGILGEAAGRRVALDLNQTHTISLFGVQGGGKSYTLGSIIEMAVLPAAPVNMLPRPLATIVFHYSKTRDYAPEFTSMINPNDDPGQVRQLRERYGGAPAGLSDVVLLAPSDRVDDRRREYPGITVLPLRFGAAELRAEHWRFLMGAVGNQATYIRQVQRIMRSHRDHLGIDVIRRGIENSNLTDNIKDLARARLDLAADYVDDHTRVSDLARPGRLIIVDLRDELVEKDEALGLFVVLMELFAEGQDGGQPFNKLVVFDEAHKYMDSSDLVAALVESVREMRHKGMSTLVASQDPPSVPIPLIELSSQVILHKFTSPAWLKHMQKANAALADLTPARMANLTPGEAYVWSSRATDAAFTRGTVKVQARPRITRHGGGTKTALGM